MLLSSPLFTQADDAVQREQIGEVLGKPVYRDQIRTGKGVSEPDELHRLFSRPVMQKYQGAHKAEIELTNAELDAATAYFSAKHPNLLDEKSRKEREQLAPAIRKRQLEIEAELKREGLSDARRGELEQELAEMQPLLEPFERFFARFMLGNWKFQRHLYDKYGGGRILWQQAGLEAFDAMHEWLKAHEKKGDFKITNPQLRDQFYHYWTRDHGPFVLKDPEAIRAEFLEPEWAPKKQPIEKSK
jgi:hypothetical protein